LADSSSIIIKSKTNRMKYKTKYRGAKVKYFNLILRLNLIHFLEVIMLFKIKKFSRWVSWQDPINKILTTKVSKMILFLKSKLKIMISPTVRNSRKNIKILKSQMYKKVRIPKNLKIFHNKIHFSHSIKIRIKGF
jgi:hypothetical protein